MVKERAKILGKGQDLINSHRVWPPRPSPPGQPSMVSLFQNPGLLKETPAAFPLPTFGSYGFKL